MLTIGGFGNSFGMGFNVGVSYSDGDWSFSGGFGAMSYGNYNGFGKNSSQVRYSFLANYDDGKTGFSLGTNFWRGDFKQRTGMIGFKSGDFGLMYENDGGAGIKHLGLGDRGDSYRSAALNFSFSGTIDGERFEDITLGLNLFTGYRDQSNDPEKFSITNDIDKFGRKYPRGFVNEVGKKYRLGVLTIGYKGYRIGVNSEKVRHAIQDRFIHGLIKDAGFENTSWNWKGYSQYNTPNIFTSW